MQLLTNTHYRTWTDNPEGADFESAVSTISPSEFLGIYQTLPIINVDSIK